jgi:hypothetical protein
MPSYTMSFSCVKIKRASLERDFYTALFVYNGINLHTVRHKSVLHNISQSQSHHPATRQPSLPRLVQTYLINRGHHALHQPPLRMQCRRRAFVRRLTTQRRRSQPYNVLWDRCVVSLGVCPNILMSCES